MFQGDEIIKCGQHITTSKPLNSPLMYNNVFFPNTPRAQMKSVNLRIHISVLTEMFDLMVNMPA